MHDRPTDPCSPRALLAVAAAPALAADAAEPRRRPETQIRNMADYLEAVVDPRPRRLHPRLYRPMVLCPRARRMPAAARSAAAALRRLAGRRFRPLQRDPRRRLALPGRQRRPSRTAPPRRRQLSAFPSRGRGARTARDGQALFLLRLDERGEIDHAAAGRLQLSRARHGDDALHRRDRRPRRAGRDRLADRAADRRQSLRRARPTSAPRSRRS